MPPPAYQNPYPGPPSHARPVVPGPAGARARQNPYPGAPARGRQGPPARGRPGPPARGRARPPTRSRPVFTDPSGRRVRRMRLIGACAGGALVAFLIVMLVGLLGGPGASFIPWAGHNGGGSADAVTGRARSAGPGSTPAMPAKPVSSGRSGATRGGSPSPSASPPASPTAAPSPSPAVTNRAGKKPPGLNRTPTPSPPTHGP